METNAVSEALRREVDAISQQWETAVVARLPDLITQVKKISWPRVPVGQTPTRD